MLRASNIQQHLVPSNLGSSNTIPKQAFSSNRLEDDIVIVSAYRTPICKAKKGGFNNTSAVTLLAAVFRKILQETQIDPKLVSDIAVGTVLAPGALRHIECRMAALISGFSSETCVKTVNRQCSSGLQAVADVASSIRSNFYEIGIAAGVESMTSDSKFEQYAPIHDQVTQEEDARNCLIPMGITSENVAKKFGITRKQQDRLALQSHQRATFAASKLREEIVPVETIQKDFKTGAKKNICVEMDDGVRGDSTAESLANLRPAFIKNGTTTAGNSSQVSDGAAAVLIMKRSMANKLGLSILGKFRSFAVAGCPPDIMGIGPAVAIPKAIAGANGITLDDIDLFEINEAFASQAAYCVDKLKLSQDKVNVNGGAIAFGHPLGCTGTRMLVTLLYEMRRRSNAKYGVVSMCIGTGMGAAAVFEKE